MDAAWRNWYLGALGVVRYLPRDAVIAEADVAAPVEAPLQVPTAAAVVVPQPVAITAGRDVARPPLPDIAPVADKTARPAPPSAAAPMGRQPDSQEDDDERVSFRLAFWQPSNHVVVLSAMPTGSRPGSAQLDMLANLLKAIGQLPAPLPSVELLDWPLSPGADASVRGARQLLTAFLDVKQQLKPFRWVLLMGQMAARLATVGPTPAVGERPDLGCKAQGVVTHSLYEMDRDKALKRDTWEALRFLAGESG